MKISECFEDLGLVYFLESTRTNVDKKEHIILSSESGDFKPRFNPKRFNISKKKRLKDTGVYRSSIAEGGA